MSSLTRLQIAEDGNYFYNGNALQLTDEFLRCELHKAVTAGYPTIAPGTNAANILEDLSSYQVALTGDPNTDFKMLRQMPKEIATSTVFQYSVLQSWGAANQTYYMAEIDLPQAPLAQYTRRTEEVRFMGTLGQVSYAANLSNALMDPKAQATRDSANALLESIESEIFNGVAALNPKGLAFDGFKQRILAESPSANVFDLHNKPLTSLYVDAALGLGKSRPNNAKFTHLMLSPNNKQAYNRSYNPILRGDIAAAGTRNYNIDFETYQSSAGKIIVEDNKYIDNHCDGTVPINQPVGFVPASPTVIAAPAAGTPPAGVTSSFIATDSGTYFYWAQARNRAGFSQTIQLNTTALNVTAGQVVSLTLKDASQQGVTADYFIIYRTQVSDPNAQNFYEIARVPNIINNGPQNVAWNDTNFTIPNTSTGLLLQMDNDALSWVQLLPMMKQAIGVRQTADEFMTLLFGVPAFKAPNRFMYFRNIQNGAVILS